MTNVPALQWTPTGLVAPAEADILAGVQADIDAAFGGGVNPDLRTSQGQLASSEAAVIGTKNDDMLAIANGVDPAYASGRMQDAIGRIYFLTRDPAQPTTVACLCSGATGTIITTGALASDGTNVWVCQQGGAIPVGGSITLSFACAVTGPVACPANSVNRVFQTVPGWDSVNNPAEGVLGNDVESRADFEHRRQETVQANAIAPIQAIKGAALKVAGVLDAYAYQNDTSAPVTVGGVTIGANQVYVCVSGGDPVAVANAIWTKKPPGSPWFAGNTSETVFDTDGYSLPYPSYAVTFQTAAALPILVAVSIPNTAQLPSDADTQIKNAIVAAFTGADGGERARIGSTIYATRYVPGIAALGSWAQVISIKVGTSAANLDDLTSPIDHIPTIDPSNITVTHV